MYITGSQLLCAECMKSPSTLCKEVRDSSLLVERNVPLSPLPPASFFKANLFFTKKQTLTTQHIELSRLVEETKLKSSEISFQSYRSFKFTGYVPAAVISPGRAMLFISLGSLGCRFSLRLVTDWDLPRWKNESQLPTGDFLGLAGGRLLLQHGTKHL